MSQDHTDDTEAAEGRGPATRTTLEALRPATIRQLLEADQAHSTAKFTIDGIEVVQVTVVAHVARILVSGSKIDYHLEDGSSKGRIVAQQWLSDGGLTLDQSEQGKIYARVQGRLSRFRRDGRNELKVTYIRKTTDSHEWLFHLLEAFFATQCINIGPPPSHVLKSIRGHPSALMQVRELSQPASADVTLPDISMLDISALDDLPPARPQRRASTPEPSRSTSQARQEIRSPDPYVAGSSRSFSKAQERDRAGSNKSAESSRTTPQKEGRDPFAHLSVLQRRIILHVIDTPASKDGVYVGSIARGVRRQDVTAVEIAEALDFLCNESYIEFTIDESHYRATRKCHIAQGIYAVLDN